MKNTTMKNTTMTLETINTVDLAQVVGGDAADDYNKEGGQLWADTGARFGSAWNKLWSGDFGGAAADAGAGLVNAGAAVKKTLEPIPFLGA